MELLPLFVDFISWESDEEKVAVLLTPADKGYDLTLHTKSGKNIFKIGDVSNTDNFRENAICAFSTILSKFVEKNSGFTPTIIIQYYCPDDSYILYYNLNKKDSTIFYTPTNKGLEHLKKLVNLNKVDLLFNSSKVIFLNFYNEPLEMIGIPASISKMKIYNADAIITGDGSVFMYDSTIDGYIRLIPLDGTVFINTNKKFFGEKIQISNFKVTLLLEVTEKKSKYMFHRCYEIKSKPDTLITTNIVKELCEKNKVDRIVLPNGKIYWFDSDTKELASCRLHDGIIFDEITQMNVEFKYGNILPTDPKSRFSFLKHTDQKEGLSQSELALANEVDHYNTFVLPDGEYVDFLTQEKFCVKNGEVVKQIKAKYVVLSGFDRTTEDFKIDFLNRHKNGECIICPESGLIYKLTEKGDITTIKIKPDECYKDAFSNYTYKVNKDYKLILTL